ncbi:hypothetical protein COB57_01190 [Candidatus Peregrinibacteria bacterium]|nr:MAG: hypothetical protein COB57_01190 [Candidatus Peregrinibacteria bacterium]
MNQLFSIFPNIATELLRIDVNKEVSDAKMKIVEEKLSDFLPITLRNDIALEIKGVLEKIKKIRDNKKVAPLVHRLKNTADLSNISLMTQEEILQMDKQYFFDNMQYDYKQALDRCHRGVMSTTSLYNTFYSKKGKISIRVYLKQLAQIFNWKETKGMELIIHWKEILGEFVWNEEYFKNNAKADYYKALEECPGKEVTAHNCDVQFISVFGKISVISYIKKMAPFYGLKGKSNPVLIEQWKKLAGISVRKMDKVYFDDFAKTDYEKALKEFDVKVITTTFLKKKFYSDFGYISVESYIRKLAQACNFHNIKGASLLKKWINI